MADIVTTVAERRKAYLVIYAQCQEPTVAPSLLDAHALTVLVALLVFLNFILLVCVNEWMYVSLSTGFEK